MIFINKLIIFVLSFALISLASKRIGDIFSEIRLPKISGYLVTGLLAGPFMLGLISQETVEGVRFIDELSLAFIAFAAGSELYLPELRGRFRGIGLITSGLVVTTMILGVTSVFLLADYIPFMVDLTPTGRFGVALLAGAIMVARSPSVAIAIITELRAKGPFTQIALGVTIVSDVAVIIIFSFSNSVATALLTGVDIDVLLIILVIGELGLSVGTGYLLGRTLEFILSSQTANQVTKTALILCAGYGLFVGSDWLSRFTHGNFPVEIHLEPLFICLVAGFIVNNFTAYRLEFSQILHDTGPVIYIIFFTLVGAGLKLDILALVWPIALALFAIRTVSIIIGALVGGRLAGEDREHNRMRWMVFITQAGVALGLATQVGGTYPDWGADFATTIIAMVVLNEIFGPVLFKWAIHHAGEAHTRAVAEFDGTRDCLIFGLEGQALALARQLSAHGWQVKIAAMTADYAPDGEEENTRFSVYPISAITLKTLHYLNADRADAIVALLSDEENYRICELAYENFGTETVVVRLNQRTNFDRFHELGVLIVDPTTAIVSLYDHLVRSPSAASLLLGTDEKQDILDIEVRDPTLDGVPIRNMRLPLDTMILSINRDGHTIVSHGYTRLKLGDNVTVVGSQESLDKLSLRFEGR
ncbi:MAG TPA: cation:proton antiporter [Anaerolineae bacterium]|nr:cation:proton antiporter [Anaerolineae bacterium]HMR65366.1 cation:proton antiporter [Anaerolineae bacterium]